MPWVKIDDSFADHPKHLRAGPLGVCLWLAGLAYCNRQAQHDGFIPAEKVPVLYPLPKPMVIAETLVAVGLWHRVEGGFLVHDYHEYQPTAEEVAALREKRAAAGRLGGKRSGEARAKHNGSTDEASTKQSASQVGSKRPSKNERFANPVPVPVPEEHVDPLPVPEERQCAPRAAHALAPPDDFARFWVVYPRKAAKAAALKAWAKIDPDPALVEAIMAGLVQAKRTRQWREDVIPHAATWLNGRRWEDEAEPTPPLASSNPKTAGNAAAIAEFIRRRQPVTPERREA